MEFLFEWDDAKAAVNLARHGVSFEQGTRAFADAFAIEWLDDGYGHAEERVTLLGKGRGALLCVVYTERGERIRLISVRHATREEQDEYYRQNAG